MTPQHRIKHDRKVLPPFNSANASLKLKKRNFLNRTTDFLGHVIATRLFEIASNITDVIRRLKLYPNVTQERSFVGLGCVFRRFVPSFAWIAAPLARCLMKNHLVTFLLSSSEEHDALKTLNAALMTPLVLALPYSGSYVALETDAYSVQVGRVILPKHQGDTTEPNCNWS